MRNKTAKYKHTKLLCHIVQLLASLKKGCFLYFKIVIVSESERVGQRARERDCNMFYVLRPGVYFIPIYIYRDTNASTSSMCEYTVYLSNEHHKVLQVRQCLRRHQSRSATRSYHSVHKHKERPLELHPPLDSAKISWRRKYSSHVFRGFFFILLSF